MTSPTMTRADMAILYRGRERSVIFRLPTIRGAVEFRRTEYGWTQTKMAKALGMSKGRYSEFLHGKRRLGLNARCKAFEIGVPAEVLLQTPKTKRAYELRNQRDEAEGVAPGSHREGGEG